ncbi:protein kinase domain-containing protein [Stygiolobus caldivivus]|uniref:Serine/threonine protein kinase n=1 Tax=Stygiolobus caldivivus TaxID=2824673 RepID=A0A8D5ZGI9_9CREN|nr:protein kinase [Stygiolobus caldivivus]BCU70978.1 serine/threonine protein kinase [Stygiolobus caldivivus]
MFILFTKDGEYYLYLDGTLRKTQERPRLKGNVIGYVIRYENGRVKLTSTPVYDSSKLDGLVEAVLVGSIKELKGYIFQTNDSIILHFGEVKGNAVENVQYLLVHGMPVQKGDIKTLINYMDTSYDLVKYMLKEHNTPEVVRSAVIALSRLNKCEEAIQLYNSLDSKFPEESLAVAECYEKVGEELQALKIYSFFSENKYRELERKLREKVNTLIDEFDRTGNVKTLFEALKVLPTYDAPSLKLGWYFMSKKNYREAVKYFEEAVKLRRDFSNLLALANAYVKNQQYEQALKIIEEAEKLRRNSSTAYLKGLAFEALNSPSGAMKEFLFACKEGLVEACSKIKPYMLYTPRDEFDPNSWIGYVLYGYKVEKVIGTGGMGYVLLVEKGMRKFAMKVVKKEFRYDELLYEVAKMQEISKGSTNLVRIFASFVDENFTDYYSSPPAIVMEYMEGGDLREVLVNSEYSTLRHSSKWSQLVAVIFSKLADAVVHVNKNGYVHCDIKPSNVLFTSRLPKYGDEALDALVSGKVEPKLSDLGSAVKLGLPVIHYTPYYAHPLQRFGGKAEYNFDVYSFTVSLYVALTNNFPFPEWLEREVEEAVTNPSKRESVMRDFYNVEPRMDYVPEEFRDLIERGLRGEISMEVISRELKYLIRYSYGIDITSNPSTSTIEI